MTTYTVSFGKKEFKISPLTVTLTLILCLIWWVCMVEHVTNVLSGVSGISQIDCGVGVFVGYMWYMFNGLHHNSTPGKAINNMMLIIVSALIFKDYLSRDWMSLVLLDSLLWMEFATKLQKA